jgi:acyl carrier protein
MEFSLNNVKEVMVEHLKHVDDSSLIGDDDELKTLGLDSMSAMNLMFDLEDAFEVEFDDSLMTPEVFKTARSLYEAVASLLEIEPA